MNSLSVQIYLRPKRVSFLNRKLFSQIRSEKYGGDFFTSVWDVFKFDIVYSSKIIRHCHSE